MNDGGQQQQTYHWWWRGSSLGDPFTQEYRTQLAKRLSRLESQGRISDWSLSAESDYPSSFLRLGFYIDAPDHDAAAAAAYEIWERQLARGGPANYSAQSYAETVTDEFLSPDWQPWHTNAGLVGPPTESPPGQEASSAAPGAMVSTLAELVTALQAAHVYGSDIWELLESLLESEFEMDVCFHDQAANDDGLEFAFHFVPGAGGTYHSTDFPVGVEDLRSKLYRDGRRLIVQWEAVGLHQTLTAADATQEDLDDFLNELRFDPDRSLAVLAELADSWIMSPSTSHADRPTTLRQWHAAIVSALHLPPSLDQASAEAPQSGEK